MLEGKLPPPSSLWRRLNSGLGIVLGRDFRFFPTVGMTGGGVGITGGGEGRNDIGRGLEAAIGNTKKT